MAEYGPSRPHSAREAPRVSEGIPVRRVRSAPLEGIVQGVVTGTVLAREGERPSSVECEPAPGHAGRLTFTH